jgi:hypothetical protein
MLVFLRAIQQQNVTHSRYILASITPFLLALAEVTSLLYVVKHGFESVPWVGLGGSLGAVFAMFVYKKYLLKK